MPYTTSEAREAGEHRGYEAANYAANVSGQPTREPQRDQEPSMGDEAWAAYADGWGAGAGQYAEADQAEAG